MKHPCADSRCLNLVSKPNTYCADCIRRQQEAERREREALTVRKDNERRHK